MKLTKEQVNNIRQTRRSASEMPPVANEVE